MTRVWFFSLTKEKKNSFNTCRFSFFAAKKFFDRHQRFFSSKGNTKENELVEMRKSCSLFGCSILLACCVCLLDLSFDWLPFLPFPFSCFAGHMLQAESVADSSISPLAQRYQSRTSVRVCWFASTCPLQNLLTPALVDVKLGPSVPRKFYSQGEANASSSNP